MKQPTKIPKTETKTKVKKRKFKKSFKKSSTASKTDGSGLETFFRVNILEKLGINYEQQFEAVSIGRFYDFHLLTEDGKSLKVLIEIDGDYFHSNPDIYEKPINKMQIRNKKIDKLKNSWAKANGYNLIRFWEKEILKECDIISQYLNSILNLQYKKILIEQSKKDGSFFLKNKNE